MPNYNNSMYNAYAYPNNQYQAANQQPYLPQNISYQAAPMTGICWVDGEVGAKAQQIPPGWDTTKPFPMWDTNDQIIYLKSFNSMGMPNPLTKLHYTIEEASRQAPMMNSQTALPTAERQDLSGYAKKEDLEQLKDELKTMIKGSKEGKYNG